MAGFAVRASWLPRAGRPKIGGMAPPAPRRVVFVLYPTFELLDVCGPLDVLAIANRLSAGRARYRPYAIELAAPEAGPVASSAGVELVAPRALRGVRGSVHTLVVPGAVDLTGGLRPSLLAWLARRAPSAERVVSVCTGARLLAAAGLLDGRRAATHWESCAKLAAEHPRVRVEPDAIFVRDGKYWTSAGITAGIDLALALVERDHDRELALAVAREMVVFLKRPGGQRQFSAPLAAQSAAGTELDELLAWIPDHLDADLSVERLAARASLSPRHFARLFRARLGTTPGRWVEAARVETARALLEGDESLPDVARAAGFGSVERLRRSFERRLGVLPSDYRRLHATREAG